MKKLRAPRIHPIVRVSYVPRIAYAALAGLTVALILRDQGRLLERGPLFLALTMGVGLAWPHVAYLLAASSRDPKRAGLRALFIDALISGFWIGLSGLNPPIGGIILAVAGGYVITIGGIGHFLRAAPFLITGILAGVSMSGMRLDTQPSLQTTLVATLFACITWWLAGYYVNRTTIDLIFTRRDLRLRNQEVQEQARKLERAVTEITAIDEVARVVNSTLDLNRVLEIVHDSLQKIFTFDQMGILKIDDAGERLVLAKELCRGFESAVLSRLRQMSIPLSEMESAFVRATSERRTIFLPRIAPERIEMVSPADRAVYLLNPAKAMLISPLILQDEVIGVAYFGNTQSYFVLSADEIKTIDRYVNHLATAIHNARLFAAAEDARAAAIEASAAKSRFLANMSHELRTPMNAIIGYSEMLREDAEEKNLEDFVEDLGKIRSAGQQLLQLINGVLDLSKVEAGKMELFPETIPVRDLIAEVVDTIEPLAQANRNVLKVECPEAVGEIVTDLTKLRQSLLNLLSNAAKFTHNGEIRLTVERMTQDGEDWIRFCVSDDGIGMTPEQQSRLFEAFTQADASTTRKFGGTGLGLSITRRFCELMGGRIAVESEAGKGSAFSIIIPVQPPEESRASTGSAPAELPHRVAKTDQPSILVIDDDPSARDLLRRILWGEGFQVVEAASGQEGLQLAREFRPHVITLDILMPQLDGWSVLEALKADPLTTDIPILMLSVIGEAATGFALDAAEYLSKPIDPDRIAQTLRSLSHSRGRGVALILDDDADTRGWLRHYLESKGWHPVEAENGRQGLDILTEINPDIVLLDLLMPGMDSLDFMRRFRQLPQGEATPVIVLTERDMSREHRRRLNDSVERLVHDGAMDRSDLLEAVRQQLTGWSDPKTTTGVQEIDV